MKIWVYAGGGHTEFLGLKACLEKSFKRVNFDLKVPHLAKNTGKPKPRQDGNITVPATTSSTGKSLLEKIEKHLPRAIDDERKRVSNFKNQDEVCDVILVIDDLDCRQYDSDRSSLSEWEKINNLISRYEKRVKEALKKTALDKEDSWSKIIVGFASPEIESWIVADWSECRPLAFTKDCWDREMKRWLQDGNSRGYHLDFENPETFGGGYNSQSCNIKLSDQIIAASENSSCCKYKKSQHSSEALQKLDISKESVTKKCPILKEMVRELQRLESY